MLILLVFEILVKRLIAELSSKVNQGIVFARMECNSDSSLLVGLIGEMMKEMAAQ